MLYSQELIRTEKNPTKNDRLRLRAIKKKGKGDVVSFVFPSDAITGTNVEFIQWFVEIDANEADACEIDADQLADIGFGRSRRGVR